MNELNIVQWLKWKYVSSAYDSHLRWLVNFLKMSYQARVLGFWFFTENYKIYNHSAAAYKLRWNILLVSMIWWTSKSPNGNVHPFPTNISISYLGLHLSITLIDNILFLFFNLQSVFNFSTKHFSYNFQTLFSFFWQATVVFLQDLINYVNKILRNIWRIRIENQCEKDNIKGKISYTVRIILFNFIELEGSTCCSVVFYFDLLW